MINTIDLLYIVLAIAALAFVVTFVYVALIFVATLKSVKLLADSLSSTTKDLEAVKDTFKVGALAFAGKFLGMLKGRR